MVELAAAWRPQAVTLVPERRQEITTEGGLDVLAAESAVGAAIERLRGAGIRTSLFINPDEAMIEGSASVKADAIELHTGEYSNAVSEAERISQLDRLRTAATRGRQLGLAIHAGHGLTYHNVLPVAAIPECEELNIGHTVVSHAVMVGMERAVREMKALLLRARA